MSITVVEDFGCPVYRFTDPDAFFSCDNPNCCQPWVTRTGLVVWSLAGDGPCSSRFTDRLLVACSSDCLRSAIQASPRGRHRWSEPMPVARWLDAPRASIHLDPATTPIGEFAGAA